MTAWKRGALRNEAGATVSNLCAENVSSVAYAFFPFFFFQRFPPVQTCERREFFARVCSPSRARGTRVFASQSCVAPRRRDWKELWYFAVRARCLSNSLESVNRYRRNSEVIWCKIDDDSGLARSYIEASSVERRIGWSWFRDSACDLTSFSSYAFFFSRNDHCKAYEMRTWVPCGSMYFYRPIWHARAIFNGINAMTSRHSLQSRNSSCNIIVTIVQVTVFRPRTNRKTFETILRIRIINTQIRKIFFLDIKSFHTVYICLKIGRSQSRR